jgi:hypothetical protein
MFDLLRWLFGRNTASEDDSSDDDFWGTDPDGPYIPGFEVGDTNAELGHSKTISGIFCRWHSRELLPPAVPLWQSFLDDDRKWASRGRFAGSERNCGHYFALKDRVANGEAKHYGIDMKTVKFLEIKTCMEKVLDLATSPGRRLAFEAVVENPNHSDPFIAEEIIEEISGGSILNDRIGLWAMSQEYEAILYVAPRAIWEPDLKAKDNIRPRKPWDYDLFAMFDEPSFRKDVQLNLVVFRGRHLLSRIEEFRIDSGRWQKNEFFNVSEDEIETALSAFPDYAVFNAEYQRRRAVFPLGRIIYSDTPGPPTVV